MQAGKILIVSAIMTFVMCFGVLCVSMASGWERYRELKVKISNIEKEKPTQDDPTVDVDDLLNKIARLEEKIDKINKDFQIDSGKIEESLAKYKNDALSTLYTLDKTQAGEDLLSAGEINAFAQSIAAINYSFDGVNNEEELKVVVENYKRKIDAVILSAENLAAAKIAGGENLKKLTEEKIAAISKLDEFKANGLLNQDSYDDYMGQIDTLFGDDVFKNASSENEVVEIYKQVSNKLESIKKEAETAAKQIIKERMDKVKKIATDKIENEIFSQRQNHPELVAELLKIRKKYLDEIALLNTEEEVASAYADFSREVYSLCG